MPLHVDGTPWALGDFYAADPEEQRRILQERQNRTAQEEGRVSGPARLVQSQQPTTDQERTMDIETLRQRQPQAYRAAVQTGVDQERQRVQRLTEAQAADPQNTELRDVVAAAIADGSSVDDVSSQIAVAIRDFKPGTAKASGHSPEVESVLAAVRGTDTTPGKLAASERARSADVSRVLDALPAQPGYSAGRN